MRCLAVITLALLVLTACLTPPQSFKPDYKVGEAAYKQRDSATALKHFRALAEQGNAKAQNILGWMYNYGLGVTKDLKEAVRWVRKAAEQGYVNGQVWLGVMYQHGEGVTRDYKEAVKWYRKAAMQGLAGAQWWLGTMYRDGEGVVQDRVMTIILLYYQGQIRVNPCRRKCFWRSRTCSHTS